MNDASISSLPVKPVEKTIVVPCAPARAFHAFTAEIGQWWPLQSHSVGGGKSTGVRLEERAGGRVFEVSDDGVEHDWGRVLTWSPPREFSMSWHPGRAADTAQTVTVSFRAEGAGTHVRLVHDGWQGPNAHTARESYDGGWETVFVKLFGDYARGL